MKAGLYSLCLVLMFFCAAAHGQHGIYDYYLNNSPHEELLPVRSDTYLFNAPLSESYSLYRTRTQFAFSAVKSAFRGYPELLGRDRYGLTEVSGSVSSGFDYALADALRRSGARPVAAAVNAGGLPGGYEYQKPSEVTKYASVSLLGTNRKGTLGGRAVYSHPDIANRLGVDLRMYGRQGEDKTLDGVYGSELYASARFHYKLREGHALSLLAACGAESNTLRSYATREAFTLAGDNYYNPAWGYWNGEKRSTKEAGRKVGFYDLSYCGRVSDRSELRIAAALVHGENSVSTPGWFDADVPYPDYYRYMPSYTGSEYVASKWKAGDPQLTQVDWNVMREANMLAARRGDGTVYLLEDRVERPVEAQLAAEMRTKAAPDVSVNYGLRLRTGRTEFYKRVNDMLGGLPFTDYDQYVSTRYEDDAAPGEEYYGRRILNNVRDAGRRVDEGDKFGYDYQIRRRSADVFAGIYYERERWRLSADISLGECALQRDGKYEKGIYPGGLSYGKSKELTFATWSASCFAGYSLSPRHNVYVKGAFAVQPQNYGNLFLSPRYANATIDDPSAAGIRNFEAGYMFSGDRVAAALTAYYTRTSGESAVYGYYDDIAAVYSDMVLSGIAKVYKGVEAALSWEMSPRVTFSAAGSFSAGRYDSDPAVGIYRDETLEPYVSGAVAEMKGYRIAAAPERLVTVGLGYEGRGWRTEASFNHMAARYVSPTPLRRMERVYGAVSASPERFAEMVSQEKLPDASTVNLTVMKYFDLGRGRLSVFLAVNNLLDSRDIIYNGYEQMRLLRRRTEGQTYFVPFDSKYLYGYGRSFYLTLTYRFL